MAREAEGSGAGSADIPALWAAAAQQMARWNWKAAEQTLERLATAEPEDVRAWSALGRARIMLGDRKGALDAWERGARVAFSHDQMWLFGSLVHEIGRYDPDRALALMDRAGRARP